MSCRKVISMKQVLKHRNYVGLTASQSSPLVGDSFVPNGFDASVWTVSNYQNWRAGALRHLSLAVSCINIASGRTSSITSLWYDPSQHLLSHLFHEINRDAALFSVLVSPFTSLFTSCSASLLGKLRTQGLTKCFWSLQYDSVLWRMVGGWLDRKPMTRDSTNPEPWTLNPNHWKLKILDMTCTWMNDFNVFSWNIKYQKCFLQVTWIHCQTFWMG